jgi:hypothetical protein
MILVIYSRNTSLAKTLSPLKREGARLTGTWEAEDV